MKKPEMPPDEEERLKALHDLGILDTDPEERFDRITRSTKAFFDVEICTLSMIDSNRQWFKGCVGLDATETDRGISFCGHAILQDDVFVIENATEDERFADNPLVTGPPNIRFYAGTPLRNVDGYKVGTLCIISDKPRVFDKDARKHLRDLSSWAEIELNSHELSKALASNKAASVEISVLKDRLKVATESAGIGVWDWDVINNILIWDDEMYKIYGISETEFSGAYEAWQAALSAENKEISEQAIADALSGKKDFSVQFTIDWPDKSVHHIQAHAIVIRDIKGQAIRMIGVNYDVTKVVEYQNELLQAKEEIEKLYSEKDSFLNRIAHDLRTPLTPVTLLLGQIKDENLSDSDRECMTVIRRNVAYLSKLITDTLTVERLDANRIDFEIKDYNLNAIVKDTLQMLGPTFDSQGIAIETELDGEEIWVKADSDRLSEVLQNILSNAVKFVNENPCIKVGVYKEDGAAYIWAHDNGSGIEKENLIKIFASFFQVDQARHEHSCGLGLAICKKMMHRMDGEIWAESEGLGQGSTFKLKVPLK